MTEEQFLRLPDDGRKYELVNGEMKEVPTSPWHEEIGAWIISLLMPFARGKGSLTGSSAGFRMAGGNIRAPDVGFTRRERLPAGGATRRGFGGYTPDLCIEIISPSETQEDRNEKLREYFASGARQVWHLFPEVERVIVYTSPTQTTTYEADDGIEVGDLLPGFRCRVKELFATEPEEAA
jgi:Uma2 family endonuclease